MSAKLEADHVDPDEHHEQDAGGRDAISPAEPDVHVLAGTGVTGKKEGAKAKTVHNVSNYLERGVGVDVERKEINEREGEREREKRKKERER